jgi:hypothetical protein
MAETKLSGKEIARRGKILYDGVIRKRVETAANLGKIVVIDVETGEYLIDDLGLDASRRLHAKREGAHLYGIRIGYQVAESLGGSMERTAP